MNKPLCRGLYAITDAQLIADDRLLDTVEQALLGGARLIQYRDKSADAVRRLTPPAAQYPVSALPGSADHQR